MRMTLGTWGVRPALGAAALGVAAALLPLESAEAQRSPQIVNVLDADGAGPNLDLRTVNRGFDLFGAADAAFSGMRATGNYGTAITNYGDCEGTLRNCQNNRINTGFAAPYFEVNWVWGVPPSQFVKIRNAAPSVSNATGGGWMAGYNRTVLGHPKRLGPADGTLGRMFSGVSSTSDGSCRDHTGFPNGFFLSGLQILPASDCEETWGSEGWQGSHPISLEGYKELFDLQGDNFLWDYWQVPEEYQSLDKQFLGTRHHTYGETSDYNVDVLTNYGAVVPGGAGSAVYQGYPLGLLLHFEAFNFAVPTVASAYFVQTLIINRSEDVWGAPVDYDSLYFGITTGTLFSTQNNSRYALPEYGMVVHHQPDYVGPGGPCYDPSRAVYAGNGCALNSVTRGYGAGAAGLMILKSPLGDMRNKLFSRSVAGTPCAMGVDPFCNPSHPNAGDTITFNRQMFGDFGGAEAATFGTSVRAAFGYLAGDEVNTLDGRNISDLNERTQWRTFRSERWEGSSSPGATKRDYYNKYVPPASPAWDYNKDGIPDTLALSTCGVLGCAVVDSDTMPGGFMNNRGNVGGLQSFGPFSLAGGDTTSIIYAHVGEPDEAQFWATVNAVMDLYLNFYLSPEAPPPVRVASTAVTAATDALGSINPTVGISFSDDPENWVDPFLTKVAEDIDNAGPGTPLADLRDRNTGLADLVRARAADNFHRLEVYKSCDGGNTFTADGDCAGDQATTASGTGDIFGWRWYAVADMDDNDGDIPNAFFDANVDGGRTYLYVFVAKSRGATFLLNTAAGPDSVTFAPQIWNPLSRSTSDPNVVSVYVPASKPAGYQAATVTFTSTPTATVPFGPNLTDNVVTASYRAVFGNEILVERDSSISAGAPVRSFVTIRHRANVDVAGVSTDSIVSAELFTFSSPEVFLVTSDDVAVGAPVVVSPDTVRTPTLYSGLGFVIAGPNGPIFGGQTLTGGAATPASLLGRPEFPGFTISANNAVAGNHSSGAETQVRGPESIAEQNLEPFDSIVPRARVNSFMVQWMEASSTRSSDGGGLYEVNWQDDPFGVERGFVLNLLNPAATEAEVQATLASRTLATTGLVDAATATLLNVDQTDLVPVRTPFTIRNVTYDRPVEIAMTRRVSNRILLGNGADTISVAVQEDQWVPGDALVFLEDIVEDSVTSAGLVLDGSGQPVQRTRRAATLSPAVLGCGNIRLTCNPVIQTTPGATGYLPMRNGDQTRFEYFVGFSPNTEYAFNLTAPVTGDQITAVTDSALALIRVVPNPYVIFSQYQTSAAEGRLLFTNLPSRGTLRIYTVAAQLVQQITWEPADLQGDGDLFWNLRTREGIDIASGLYLWVLTAPSDPSNPSSTPINARGKFVVIRGDSR